MKATSHQPPATKIVGEIRTHAMATAPSLLAHLLPEFRSHRLNLASQQPMVLELQVQPRWTDLGWAPWLAFMGAWTGLITLLGLGAAKLHRTRQQTRQTEQVATTALHDLAVFDRRAELRRGISLEELGAGFAHELTQPLTAVVSYSQTALRLLESVQKTLPSRELEEIRRTLRANTQQALRAGALMQKLRTLVHSHAIHKQSLNLQTVLNEALRMEQARFTAAGVRMTTDLPTEPIHCLGDAMLLEQMTSNLLRNAVEALDNSTPGGERRVWLRLQAFQDGAHISVQDNGPGMSDERMAKAFHPFQSTKPGGLGMGLVICHTIAQAHGGEIGVHRLDGGGTSFIITLPCYTPVSPENPSTT